mgnify:CR=1 FL=1|tara:strand:- start:251 stop:433 length:183 start_codon:yes stop_codon:yes gene_type:complete
MEMIKNITASKKFWYAFGTLAILLFSDSIGINDQEVHNIIMVALGLIVAQGIADCKGCKR